MPRWLAVLLRLRPDTDLERRQREIAAVQRRHLELQERLDAVQRQRDLIARKAHPQQ